MAIHLLKTKFCLVRGQEWMRPTKFCKCSLKNWMARVGQINRLSSSLDHPIPSMNQTHPKHMHLPCTLCLLAFMTDRSDGPIGSLPEHLLIEIFVRLPNCEWVQISCVSKHWASIFQGEYLWQTAIARKWPSAGFQKRWPGPIPRGSARRRFQALYVSENLVPSGGGIDELVGHTYLYLQEQLEHLPIPPSSILHGTIIDQFIACGRSGEKAHELASKIWLAVIDNLEENQQTFWLLKHLTQEGEFFLPFPYSRSYKVLWRVFDKLFTDFRDCFNRVDYHDALASAKSRFQPVPSTWLGH